LKAVDPIDGWKAISIPSGDAALRSISTSHHNDLELCTLFSSCLDILKRGSPSYKPQMPVSADVQPPRKFSVTNVTSSEYTEEDIALAMTGLESKSMKGKHRLSMTRRMSKLLVTDTSIVMGDQTTSGNEPGIKKELFDYMAEEEEEEEISEKSVSDVVEIPRAMNFSGQMSLPDIIASRDDGEDSMTPMTRQDSSNEGWTLVSPDSPVIVEYHDPEIIESIEQAEASSTPMYRREDSSPEIVEATSLDFYSATPKYRPESKEDTNDSLDSDSDAFGHLSNYSDSSAPSTRRKSSRPEIISRQTNASSSYTPRVSSSLASLGQPEVILSVNDGSTFTPRDSVIKERPEVMLESTNGLVSMTPLDNVESEDYTRRKPSVSFRSSQEINKDPKQYTNQQIRAALEAAPKEYAQLVTLNLESTYLDQFISSKLVSHNPSTINTVESEDVYAIIEFAYPKVTYDCADELLVMAEPNMEIDMGVVISRPPAFVDEDEGGSRVGTTVVGKVDKRRYGEFPRFRRGERNARGNPFG
jgi:hypothetical protein